MFVKQKSISCTIFKKLACARDETQGLFISFSFILSNFTTEQEHWIIAQKYGARWKCCNLKYAENYSKMFVKQIKIKYTS